MTADVTICVDFGSTFTKAALVDLGEGRIVASASHPTTIPKPDVGGDVLDGYDACAATLVEQDPRAADAEVLACSSAGGGLRIAVVGNEELVTAEAGRRVALSSGGKVVQVIAVSGRVPDTDPWSVLRHTTRPDVVLLTGGTDGGNAEPIRNAARALVDSGWSGPVVVAGNADARDDVGTILGAVPHVVADNVVPRIGVLAPESGRAAIREMFLAHVIGGKHLSQRADFAKLVRGATPDVVLTAVELLARGLDAEHPGAGDVVVVDVGGATTDVHSVVELDPETGSTGAGGLSREVVATTPVTRTVEGDLGMRWSAPSTVAAAGLDDLADAASGGAPTPTTCPAATASPRSTKPSPRPPPASPCAATPAAPGWWSAPRDGSSSGPARTCARSTCSSARAGCSATAVPASPGGPSRGVSAPMSRAAGSFRETRASWSTPTTCWPPRVSSRADTRRRRTGW